MLPIYMIQSQGFWQQEMPLRNIHPFNATVPMQDTAKPLSKMFPVNWALVLIFQYGLSLNEKSCPSDGLLSLPWLGSTIPAVLP